MCDPWVLIYTSLSGFLGPDSLSYYLTVHDPVEPSRKATCFFDYKLVCVVVGREYCFNNYNHFGCLSVLRGDHDITFGGLSGILRPLLEMTTEALRTQLDALRVEKQQLEVQNRRLREENVEGAQLLDAQSELQRSQREHERALAELEEV